MLFFTPKFMKIKCYMGFFVTLEVASKLSWLYMAQALALNL